MSNVSNDKSSSCTSSLSESNKHSQNGEDAQNSCNQIDCYNSKSNAIDTNVLCEIVDQISDYSTTENNPEAIMNPRIHDNETLEEATNWLFFKDQVWSSFYEL